MPEPYLSSPFNPPAPGCQVSISFGTNVRQYPALIDSGAAMTCIPGRLVRDLALIRIADTGVTGATGHTEQEGIYRANLEFLGMRFNNFPVTSLRNKAYMIIGRDILNKYLTTLNGPALDFSIV
jgi:predicted aspartyl protease